MSNGHHHHNNRGVAFSARVETFTCAHCEHRRLNTPTLKDAAPLTYKTDDLFIPPSKVLETRYGRTELKAEDLIIVAICIQGANEINRGRRLQDLPEIEWVGLLKPLAQLRAEELRQNAAVKTADWFQAFITPADPAIIKAIGASTQGQKGHKPPPPKGSTVAKAAQAELMKKLHEQQGQQDRAEGEVPAQEQQPLVAVIAEKADAEVTAEALEALSEALATTAKPEQKKPGKHAKKNRAARDRRAEKTRAAEDADASKEKAAVSAVVATSPAVLTLVPEAVEAEAA